MNMPDGNVLIHDGNEIDNYPINYNPKIKSVESNGGIEHIIDYQGFRYSVITDCSGIPYEVGIISRRINESSDWIC
jgi:hypothetical protein